jgi:hypothetical protein
MPLAAKGCRRYSSLAKARATAARLHKGITPQSGRGAWQEPMKAKQTHQVTAAKSGVAPEARVAAELAPVELGAGGLPPVEAPGTPPAERTGTRMRKTRSQSVPRSKARLTASLQAIERISAANVVLDNGTIVPLETREPR